MYENFIGNYVKKLKKEDIIEFCLKDNINISNDEVDIIYYYVKNNWRDILYNPDPYMKLASEKLSKEVYEKLVELKKRYKF